MLASVRISPARTRDAPREGEPRMKSGFGRCIHLAGGSLVAVLAMTTTPASAQAGDASSQNAVQPAPGGGPAAPPAAQPEDTGEGGIVVTALRRTENLQDVPAAITAFTRDTVEAAGIE